MYLKHKFKNLENASCFNLKISPTKVKSVRGFRPMLPFLWQNLNKFWVTQENLMNLETIKDPFLKALRKKLCMREALNLSTCADGSTNSFFFLMRWQLSCVMCCVSPVTCHMAVTPTATAKDPPPANTPISMHISMLLLILT